MARIIQPCDWHEHDVNGNYVVDVYGRLDNKQVACVRITGFKPYFYVDGPKPQSVHDIINKQWDVKFGPKKGQKEFAYILSKKISKMADITATATKKYDVMSGFCDLKTTDVWKVECGSLAAFHGSKKSVEGRQFESNLTPLLRLFHDCNLGPASPFQFKAVPVDIPVDDNGEPSYFVDEFYECSYQHIQPNSAIIPMMVASYDLEMYSKSGLFPRPDAGDPIIQIGISYRWSNNLIDPVGRVVFVVGSVDKSEDKSIEFISCKDEADMLIQFAEEIRTENPDIMCGYNIFGFDDAYIEGRCMRLGILENFNLARKKDEFGDKKFETKKFELASGKYDLRFLTLRGRLGIDLLLNMRREHSLDSFKLDNVANTFLRDKVVDYGKGRCSTKSTRGLIVGNYVKFDIVGNTSDPYRDGAKFKVTSVDPKGFTIDEEAGLFTDLTDKERKSLEWTFTKDDVEPHELFRLHAHGGSEGRARIAKYCIQDCDLVLTLMAKLDTIVNARGMADVCKVPMEYVLRRGQGIKIFSAVVYYASQRDQILQTQIAADYDTGYEGAIVLPPKIGMYLDQPISVLDFNSLYPTNMISYNLSPDTLVCQRSFNSEGQKISHEGLTMESIRKLEDKGYVLEEIEYDTKDEKDVIIGKTLCTFVQPNGNEMTVGVLPKTLDILLKKRKEFKEKMEDTQYDEAQRSVFNGLQLAYKVVANSVYGQTGSRTSPIRKLCVAACTTAAGRKALGLAKHIVETEFGAEVIYGDTDSIFIKFPTKSLEESITLGIAAGKRITSQCRKPYKIAYEKTFFPFILFCRKRYVGMKYEEDPSPSKAKRMSMGIVLKRRDNAPIVKDVFGGALDILIQERDIKKAQTFVNAKLLEVIENRVPLEKFIISKSLRDDYKNPGQIAHRVLADRMAARDPGTAPKVGDRLQFIFVAENSKGAKQGDRIEEVGYVKSKGLKPDSQFYITNQIQNPVAQLFALCIENLDGYIPPSRPSYKTLMEQMMEKHKGDEEDAIIAVLGKKEKQLDDIMFLGSPVLSKIVRSNVRGPMDAFIKRA